MYSIEFADRLSRNRLFVAFAVASLALAVIASLALATSPASAAVDEKDQSSEDAEVYEDGEIFIEGEVPEEWEKFVECESAAFDELAEDVDFLESEDAIWEECKQHLPAGELEQIEADMEAWAPFDECMVDVFGDFDDAQVLDVDDIDFDNIDFDDVEFEDSEIDLEAEEACLDLLPEDIQQEIADLDAEWAEFDACATTTFEDVSEDISDEELKNLLEKNCGDLAPEDAEFGFELVE